MAPQLDATPVPAVVDSNTEQSGRKTEARRPTLAAQSKAPPVPEQIQSPVPAQPGVEAKLPADTVAMIEDRNLPTSMEATAVIALAVAPWGEIYVDGERKGVSPPVNEVEVAPGKRSIEIRNANFPVYTEVVELKADQKIRIKHKFSQD